MKGVISENLIVPVRRESYKDYESAETSSSPKEMESFDTVLMHRKASTNS